MGEEKEPPPKRIKRDRIKQQPSTFGAVSVDVARQILFYSNRKTCVGLRQVNRWWNWMVNTTWTWSIHVDCFCQLNDQRKEIEQFLITNDVKNLQWKVCPNPNNHHLENKKPLNHDVWKVIFPDLRCFIVDALHVPDNVEYKNENPRDVRIAKCLDDVHHLSQAVNLQFLGCPNIPIMVIPPTLSNLVCLDCSLNLHIDHIPSTLIHLQMLICFCTNVTAIPDTLTRLRYLDCQSTHVKSLPHSLTALECLSCVQFHINEMTVFLSSSLKVLEIEEKQEDYDFPFHFIFNPNSRLEILANGNNRFQKIREKWIQINRNNYENQRDSKLNQLYNEILWF